MLDLDRTQGRQVMRTALLHLVARGHLHLERPEQKKWYGAGNAIQARLLPQPEPLPPPLRVVLEALHKPGQADQPIGMTNLLYRLQQTFGAGYGRYLAQHVRSALVTRGLLRVEESRALGVFRRRRYRLTPNGEVRRAQLQKQLEAAGKLPDQLRDQPRQAAVTAAGLGALILLVDELRPHYGALAEVTRRFGTEAALLLELEEAEREERLAMLMDTLDMLSAFDLGELLSDFDGFFDGAGGGADGVDGGGGDGGGGD